MPDAAYHTAITGTHGDKYTNTGAVARRIVQGFFRDLNHLVAAVQPASIIEAGCGEGEALSRLHLPRSSRLVALDWGRQELRDARERTPSAAVLQGSIYSLPFGDASADLVLALEVLEHLEDPVAGLREVARVTRRHAIVSVPREPFWRVLNYARGKYREDWGNTPGHLQHWGQQGICRLVVQEMEIRAIRSPFPWTMLLLEKRA